jgi:ABC-2 type transport system permease protein
MGGIARLLAPRLRGLLNRWKRAGKGMRTASVFFLVFGLGFWVGWFFLMHWLIGAFHAVEVFGPILTRKLLELLLLGMFGMLCFSSTVTGLSTFYLAEDLELVLSLPIPRWQFHFARLIDTGAQSSWMVVVFGLPVFLAYGITHGAGPDFYALLMVVLPCFIAMPVSVGVVVASLLVTATPARRVREVLVFAGVLTLVFVVVMLRVFRPEQLVDASNFDSVAAYVAELQAPVPLLIPPRWAADLLGDSLQGRPLSWLTLGLLVSGAIALTGVGRWLTTALYDRGRSRSQEAQKARLATAGWLDILLGRLTRPLGPVLGAVVIKDIKTFIRDPAQWSQLLLVGSIVVISLVSVAALPVDVVRGPWMGTFRNVLAFGVLGLVGFVMAALAARFQFTAVSMEGQAWWVIRSSPITAHQYLWSKLLPGLVAMIAVGETMAVASTWILGAGNFLMVVASVTALLLAMGIAGIAVGMGAIFPDFKVDNAARAASGPAGILFMVISLTLVFVVVSLESYPVYIILASEVKSRAITDGQWGAIAGCFTLAGSLCMFALFWPLRLGARRLWGRDPSNA